MSPNNAAVKQSPQGMVMDLAHTPTDTDTTLAFNSVESNTNPTELMELPKDAQRYIQRSKWKTVIEAELQDLIGQATKIREQMSSAKTQTKRQYFDKKFKKINAAVMQMVVSLQRLEHLEQEQQLKEQQAEASVPNITDVEVLNVDAV